MNERLLQYIWQHQYYNNKELVTTGGEEISILRVGTYNTNQGPDFLDARVRIGKQTLAGHVELHINSSDWFMHMHDADSNYNNVILHVVWCDDLLHKKLNVPTLVLEGRIPKFLLDRLLQWSNDSNYIPCANQVGIIPEITLTAWKERLMVERLQAKSVFVNDMLVRSGYHWEEVLWWMIARSFGLVINADAMMAVAMSIPLNVLKRHREQVFQIESMLFGQAGLLDDEAEDDYMQALANEYRYLRDKYQLPAAHCKMLFLRMRPPAFPTIRIAQLAMFFHREGELLQTMVEIADLRQLKPKINVNVSDYWNDHYVFGVTTEKHVKKPGLSTTNAILINSIIPFMYRYGEHYARSELVERAIRWMVELPAEQNKITRVFEDLGLTNATALDSQAFIQLKSKYCDHRRCLDCSIGHAVLSDSHRRLQPLSN